jgi:hypothetical protein
VQERGRVGIRCCSLYRSHDRLLTHKQAVFDHLVGRWRDLFSISYDVLLYDLGEPCVLAQQVGQSAALKPTHAGLKQRFGESRVDLMAYGQTPWS